MNHPAKIEAVSIFKYISRIITPLYAGGGSKGGPGTLAPLYLCELLPARSQRFGKIFIENLKAVNSGIASVMKLKLIARATSAETGH